MAAMRRRLLPVLDLLRAAPKPGPHRRFLHSPSLLDAVAASTSPSPNLLSRGSGSLLPTSARAVVAAAPTSAACGAGSLELLSRQLGGWLPSSWTLLRGVGALRSVWVHWRSTPEGPDSMVLMLVGANIAACALCRLADPRFKMNHFTTSLDNFKSGRLHTLLTSAFSHRNVNHLFNNMTSLYFFDSSIVGMFGPAFLLKLYLTGALTGSAFFLADMAFLAPRKQGFGGWKTHMLGASGAVNAIIFLKIFLHPRQRLYLHFLFPVPAALLGARSIGADLWRIKKDIMKTPYLSVETSNALHCEKKGHSRVSGSTHLGGAFVAALVWAKLKGWI